MAKVLATEIRPGNLIEWDKRVWRVLKSHHVHVGGRGGAFMQVEMKDIESGTKRNERIRTEDKIERAFVDQRDMQYLYSDGSGYIFMDKESFEQLHCLRLSRGTAGYLIPNTDVQVIFTTTGRSAFKCHRPWNLRLWKPSPPSRAPLPPARSTGPRPKPA